MNPDAPHGLDEKDCPGAFDKWRATVGLILGPVLAALLWRAPLTSFTPQAHALACVIAWVVTWWVCEPIPIPMTALIGPVLCVLFGVAPATKVLGPFAEPTIFLFLGSFMLARAMSVHGLDRRVAYGIMSWGWVGDSSARLLFAYGAVSVFLSMWISNTATTAMMFPIGLGIIHAMEELGSHDVDGPARATPRFGTGMMLMAAYAASAGGIGTPVGTPPNLIGIAMIDRLAGVRIPFFRWMAIAVPLLAVMYVALFALLFMLHRPEVRRIEGGHAFVAQERRRLGPWTPGQRNTLAAFCVAVTLWILPGVLTLLGESGGRAAKAFGARMPEAAVALVAAALLFVLPVDWRHRRFTLTWREGSRIDWGTLLLFGGGLSLGGLMFETGLAEAIGRGLLGAAVTPSVWALTAAAILLAIVVSEATSNTASANMVIPVVISVAQAAGANPVPPAIGATLGASWGFMLPVSTPPNAIVYGSGLIPITKMMRAGVLFDLAGGLIIWIGLRVLLPAVGLA